MIKKTNLQLALPLEFIKLKNKKNYLINENNKLALSLVYELSNTHAFKKKYSYPILYVYGPEGSGKTHLGFVFKEISNANFISQIDKKNVSMVKSGQSFIIDNLEPKTSIEQKILLHFFNESHTSFGSILILSKTPPSQVKYDLKDLNSRIKSFINAEILLPNDEVLYSILVKELHERKLFLKDSLCFYIINRIKRDYKSVIKFVFELDKLSLENKKKIRLLDVKQAIYNINYT